MSAPSPTLDQVASGADLSGLNRDQLAALLATSAAVLGRIAAAQGRLAAQLAQGDGAPTSNGADRFLDASEVANRLHVSRTWVYRNSPRLPFTTKIGGHLRFSEQKLNRFIANHAGAQERRPMTA